jgi:rhodanese-related sulfurtransferase
MRRWICLLPCLALMSPAAADPGNPKIDSEQHVRAVIESMRLRDARRVDEAQFVRLSAEPGAVILDARSPESFSRLRLRGALNLPYTELAKESLAELLPDREAIILIYCDNNFVNADPAIMRSKAPAFALNLPTFAALYDYGYRNVYELAPAVDPATTTLVLEGTGLEWIRTRSNALELPVQR